MTKQTKDDGSEAQPLDKQVEELLSEARMVLPGIQALFGFQLIAVFNEGFSRKLDHREQCAHLLALGLVALSTALLMTPAAYHRQVEPGRVSCTLVRVGTRCLNLAMLPLLLAVSVDLYLIARIILGDPTESAALAALSALTFGGLWYGFPTVMSRRT